jgi:hypothetical protein
MSIDMDIGLRKKWCIGGFVDWSNKQDLSDKLIMRLKRRKLEQVRVYTKDLMISRWLLLAFI